MATLTARLAEAGVVRPEVIREAISRQVVSGQSLEVILLDMQAIEESVLDGFLAGCHGLNPAHALREDEPAAAARALLPRALVESLRCVPLRVEGDALVVASSRPVADDADTPLGFFLGMRVRTEICNEVRMAWALWRWFDILPPEGLRRLVDAMERPASVRGGLRETDATEVDAASAASTHIAQDATGDHGRAETGSAETGRSAPSRSDEAAGREAPAGAATVRERASEDMRPREERAARSEPTTLRPGQWPVEAQDQAEDVQAASQATQPQATQPQAKQAHDPSAGLQPGSGEDARQSDMPTHAGSKEEEETKAKRADTGERGEAKRRSFGEKLDEKLDGAGATDAQREGAVAGRERDATDAAAGRSARWGSMRAVVGSLGRRLRIDTPLQPWETLDEPTPQGGSLRSLRDALPASARRADATASSAFAASAASAASIGDDEEEETHASVGTYPGASRAQDQVGHSPDASGPSERDRERIEVTTLPPEELERWIDQLGRSKNPEEADPILRKLEPFSDSRYLPMLVERFPGEVWHDRVREQGMALRARDVSGLARALVDIGPRAAASLGTLLSDSRAHVRLFATWAASGIPCRALVEPLGQRIFDADAEVRAVALHAMRKFRLFSQEAGHILSGLRAVAIGQDYMEEARAVAIDALGTLGDGASVTALISLLDASDNGIATAALRALRQITGRDFGHMAPKWHTWLATADRQHRVRWLIDALEESSPALQQQAARELLRVLPVVGEQEAAALLHQGHALDTAELGRQYNEWWHAEGKHLAMPAIL